MIKRILGVVFLCLVASMAWAGASVPDAVYNVALADIANNADQLDVVSDSTTPTDLTNSLGSVALTVGSGNGDFLISDGDTSGRKLTITAQTITASGSGTARHWVLSDGSGTIYAIGTITEKVLTASDVYEFAEKNLVEIRDAQ